MLQSMGSQRVVRDLVTEQQRRQVCCGVALLFQSKTP